MKRYTYGERDYAFAQLMLTLRTTIGLTQAGLGERLGVSRRAVAEWEAGLSYPKVDHLQQLITLGVHVSAFATGREAEEIRTLWKVAHQKVLLDERWLQNLLATAQPVQYPSQTEPLLTSMASEASTFRHIDLADALDVSHFVGYEVEVAELSWWIVHERCRLIVLLGMGGIGKSMLASYLGRHLTHEFEAVLWRSVRDAPSCEELVADCITFFAETPPTGFPTSLEQRIDQLLARLQTHRCLLVLDNLEAILESQDPTGGYLPGYEGYGRLLGRLAESAHQSCVLVTSREKPKEIEPLEGVRSPVRTLRLIGMDEQAAHGLLSDKELWGTPAAWERLVASYAGNPLALKIVAQTILDLFNGDLDQFLQEGELIFNGIRPVLRQQVGRLTPQEHQVLTWLAVLREWTPLEALSQAIHPRMLRSKLLEALEALRRRSLLERGQQASFSLQSVVMEYLTDELGERLCEEIVLGDPQQLRQVALAQAQAKDYVREIQVRLLVQPLLERLHAELGADAQVEAYLLPLLAQFRAEDASTQGYGPTNVITLLKELRGHLRGLDLSRLSIRGAYLQGVEMQDARLAGATLHEVVWTSAFDTIRAVALSPDGHYMAAGGSSGQVHIWHGEDCVAHLTIQGHTDRVGGIAFSPTGDTLATASWDGTVRLWDVASGAAIWAGQDQHVPLTSLAIGSNGKLISGSYDGVIHVWDMRTGTPLKSLSTQGGPIFTVASSSDGRLLASGGDDAGIRLWDAEQGTLLQELPGHHKWVCSLAFAPDTGLLASGSLDLTIKLWDVETGTCIRTLEGHTSLVMGLAWSPDGRTLASASYDKTLRLWDARSWQCYHILQGHRDGLTSLAFLPEGDRLLSGSLDHTLRTWDVQSGHNVRTMTGYALALLNLCWSPDGRFVLSGNSEATLTLWDVTTHTPVQVLRGHQQRVDAVAWSRATNRIASGSTDHTVRLWDARAGACTHILQGHTASVLSVHWSPDGSILASGSHDGSVRLWDVQAGTSQVSIEQGGLISAVVWSPDGTLLASASEDGLVLIFRATDGSLVRRFEQAGVIEALCWSPDGEQLASGTADGAQGVVLLWDVRRGTLVRRLEGHRGPIMGIDWSAEHNQLLSAGTDGTVRWWDPEQGTLLARVQAHEAWARTVRVSPDGKTVASCGDDGTISLWDMLSHQHLATLRAERPYERLDFSGIHGLTQAEIASLRALGAVADEADEQNPGPDQAAQF
jgi:WD40 repeat protein/transcriptional regulator with XRE-family HTH domain